MASASRPRRGSPIRSSRRGYAPSDSPADAPRSLEARSSLLPRRSRLRRRSRRSKLRRMPALPIYTIVPFVAMLLAIALLPLGVPRWWESNRNKLLIAVVLGAPVVVLYLGREPGALVRMGEEYVSFIILLAGLYVITGGILLRGDLVATPLTNAAFLA